MGATEPGPFHQQAVEEFPTDNGPVDYALCVGGHAFGLVEAKKLATGPQNVLTQAERYSAGMTSNPAKYAGYPLRHGEFHVPFLYSTNGEVIWFRDCRHPLNLSRKVAHFHTPAALQELLSRDVDQACDWLEQHPNDHPRLREYQRKANEKVEAAIRARKREMLLAMATGTGKTFTLVNQIYRLMQSGAAKRVLFLVDRRALAAQAVRAFAGFEPEAGLKFNQIYEVYSQSLSAADADDDDFKPHLLPQSYLTEPGPQHTFVYVSTIQRMAMHVLGRKAAAPDLPEGDGEEDAEELPIPIHAFDVIVADECHRGYTSQQEAAWRKTLDHFDAIKIGLTATPAQHTSAYFGAPVFTYTYEEGVRDGHLVDYDVVAVRSEARINGVFLEEGESVNYVDTASGQVVMDFLEDERQFTSTELEEAVTSPDSNRRILEQIKAFAEEHEQRYKRFPKTLIFATNDLQHTSHCDQLVRLGREVFDRGEEFVEKITGKVDRPLQRIRELRNRPQPGVAVTVDLLTTGVDIPDLEFIVFLRVVKSRILFVQMLGRGTRKGEKFPDKSHFTVFDCFDGTLLEYFRKVTDMTGDAPRTSTKTIREVIEAIWNNEDRAYHTKLLQKRLLRIEKETTGQGRAEISALLGVAEIGVFARELQERLASQFQATMATLRNEALLGLLQDPPKPTRTFIVGLEHEDTVTAEWRAKGADGKEYKPEDYLAAFVRVIKENPEQVEAIRILLDRPADWNPNALVELEEKLSRRPERFTVRQLQKAHGVRYSKALADIISMVKHAAREESPLYTAEERAAAAMQRVTEGRTFTPEQQEWLAAIQDHLKLNLSIDAQDLDSLPNFTDLGGRGRARRIFPESLDALLRDVNEAIAA